MSRRPPRAHRSTSVGSTRSTVPAHAALGRQTRSPRGSILQVSSAPWTRRLPRPGERSSVSGAAPEPAKGSSGATPRQTVPPVASRPQVQPSPATSPVSPSRVGMRVATSRSGGGGPASVGGSAGRAPQHHARPSRSVAHTWAGPAAMAVTSARSDPDAVRTPTGTGARPAIPAPSSPRGPEPQQRTSPSVRRAQKAASVATSAVAPIRSPAEPAWRGAATTWRRLFAAPVYVASPA